MHWTHLSRMNIVLVSVQFKHWLTVMPPKETVHASLAGQSNLVVMLYGKSLRTLLQPFQAFFTLFFPVSSMLCQAYSWLLQTLFISFFCCCFFFQLLFHWVSLCVVSVFPIIYYTIHVNYWVVLCLF